MRISVKKNPPLTILSFIPTQKYNVLDKNSIIELIDKLDNIYKDDSKYLVIQSESNDFGAGIDYGELLRATQDKEYAVTLVNLLKELYYKFANSPKITIAVVRGLVVGAFLELLLLMDYVIAHKESKFSIPAAKLGLIPPLTITLGTKILGYRNVFRLAFTCEELTAEEALKIGLVSRLSDDLDKTLEELINSLNYSSPLALSVMRRIIVSEIIKGIDEAFEQLSLILHSKEASDGIVSSITKSHPPWYSRFSKS
ncbi:MAG: enoyl-CoA hydratase/isomerase family protein [Sulfolobaceae archaeon]